MAVFVLDKRKQHLMPCSEKRARQMHERGRACVAIRATGSFNITTGLSVVQGIGHKHCTLLQRADGYGYQFNPATRRDALLPRLEGRGLRASGSK